MLVSMVERSVARRSRFPSGAACRMTSLLLAILLPLGAAQVRAHDTYADGDLSNDWIRGLRNSDAELCCDNNDCYPVQPGALRFSPGSDFTVEIDDRWFSVPDRSLLRESSPDGRAWVCPKWQSTTGGYSYSVKGVRCLLLPPMI